MKHFVAVSIFFVSLFLLAPKAWAADVCNKTCQVNEDCGQGYKCFVGVCRLSACASSTNCVCSDSQPTPTPIATPVVDKVAKATPVASVVPVANNPKTGSESLILGVVAILCLSVGIWLRTPEISA